jgi:hypothetical protein
MPRHADEKFHQALEAIHLGNGDGPWLTRVLKKRVIVHLTSGLSMDGVLWEQTPDGVILRAAKLLGDDGKQTSMAGEVWVPRENVAFAQLDE